MIRYLEFKGEKLPLKNAFQCLRDFENETGKNIMNLPEGTVLTMAEIEAFFYHAYKNGCLAARSEGYKVKYTREEAGEIMDECFMDFVQLVNPLIEDVTEPYKKKLLALEQMNQKAKANPGSRKKKAS